MVTTDPLSPEQPFIFGERDSEIYLPSETPESHIEEALRDIRRNPLGKALLEEAETAGIYFAFHGRFVGGARSGNPVHIHVREVDGKGGRGGFLERDTITLDNADLRTDTRTQLTLIHEMQHALDRALRRLRFNFPDSRYMPADLQALSADLRLIFIHQLEEDLQRQVETEIRAFHREQTYKDGLPYTLTEPITAEQRFQFLVANPAYIVHYEAQYTRMMRLQTTDPNIAISLHPNGSVTLLDPPNP